MPIAVSACVFILVGDIERFIVLDVVEGLVELQDLEDDLRRQLRETEACLRSLKADMVELSTGDGVDSHQCSCYSG